MLSDFLVDGLLVVEGGSRETSFGAGNVVVGTVTDDGGVADKDETAKETEEESGGEAEDDCFEDDATEAVDGGKHRDPTAL